MLKIKVTEKSGASCEYQSPVELDYSALGHGLPERWVPAQEGIDPADILESEMREVRPATDEEPAEMQEWVKLRAEYTVEIDDITAQHALAEVLAKRKLEYPSPEDLMDAFFDGGDAAVQALRQKRLEIKAKYPKPGA